MKTMKRFSAALVLSTLFCLTAIAGEMQTPPCTPGEVPTIPCAIGETHSPPGEAQTAANTAPGETHGTPPFAAVVTAAAGAAFELMLFW